MVLSTYLLSAVLVGLSAGQTLNIPARNGNVQTALNRRITANTDFQNQEFDSDIACNENEGGSPVFIVANGVTVSNLIIGARQIDGIHCEGTCTLRNVWFRDVCEDAISILGGDALITGGGANGATDKVIQHNGKSTVTIENFTVTNSGKLYRSCGNCSNNGGPRKVIIKGVRASNMKSDLAGINSNFGDTATVSGSCGSNTKTVCQPYEGRQPGGDGPKIEGSTTGCLGAQGTLKSLPAC